MTARNVWRVARWTLLVTVIFAGVRGFASSAQAAAGTITLTGSSSHPGMNTFARDQAVRLTFKVEHLSPHTTGLTLDLRIVNALAQPMGSRRIRVSPDEHGAWKTTIKPPAKRLGFYRVYARLSNGVKIRGRGSRPAGFMTYCIVPDPSKRKLYPERQTFFGMQGGFNSHVDVLPYLGVRWVLNGSGRSGYGWGVQEPDHAGQFAQALAEAKAKGQVYPREGWSWPYVTVAGHKKRWRVYTLPSLFLDFNRQHPWQMKPGTYASNINAGALRRSTESAWRNYCALVGKVYAAHHPDMPAHLYQITWEPVRPWGYKGTAKQLVRIYQIAYPALHKADPRAVVLGPTLSSITRKSNYQQVVDAFKQGLGKYIDGFSIHPYFTLPPEKDHLVRAIHRYERMIYRLTGKHLPMYGTEQGYNTAGKLSHELLQARGLIRANLIMLGEGYKMNFAFYIIDYPNRGNGGDYGFYYNCKAGAPYVTDKTEPKPIAPAYAAMTYLLEGHHSLGAIRRLGGKARGYAYETYKSDGPPEVVLALWDYGKQPRKVSLAVGVKQVTQFDWMGNKKVVATPHGQWRGTLTRQPVYIGGVSTKLWTDQAARR